MLLKKLLQTSPMSAPIDQILFVLLVISFIHPLYARAHRPIPTSRITVVGVVFCDTCSTNTFSKHSYFLPGVDVNVQCKFKANSPKTTEQIAFSVNRTTDKYGVYKLEIPHVDGVDCVEGMAIESMCQASLIGSSSAACNIPAFKTATNEISVKSKQESLCIYSLKALSYRPSERNVSLCGNQKQKEGSQNSYDSSKFFLPYYLPPYGFLWPLPQLPPLPKLPFPPLFQSPPSLSFPFPPLPTFPPSPSLFPPPPPPSFNLGDPRTWIPNIPTLSPPPPPAFNLGDPKTWIPYIPLFSPPPPPAFTLGDPRTWIPYIPPSPPSSSPQSQKP